MSLFQHFSRYLFVLFNREKGEKLTIHGYDIYKLVFANGMLIPGSTEAGVVVYNNNWNFLFSDYRSYTAWYHDFTENILRFLELARNKVFLIELFDLFNALEIIMEHTVKDKNLTLKFTKKLLYFSCTSVLPKK